ncbi:hypothetical protein N7449_001142 [Penicillium cf. viridicatum]|uniref:Glutaminase A N-terminal domain-containing protein n=1 Tax=Penicillium cf. viridicatum TaxID=2972119 RepID=A0A9W9N671_9EURO|nr:hypothetical protein N7449_001142 [Penicillium cf. viridicatum]
MVSRVICLACTFPKVVPTPAPSLRHVEAGSSTFTLDFFSPVSPQNYLHQSLPFSYLTLTVAVDDSSSAHVYSNIDRSWVGQAVDISWSHATKGTSICQIKGVDAALWGSAVHATRPQLRAHSPQLPARQPSVVEFANDLGTTTKEVTVTFAVGPVREGWIEYIGAA